MSFIFLSSRMTNETLVSEVDNKFSAFEQAFVEAFGFPIDTQIAAAYAAGDEYGFITSLNAVGIKVFEAGSTEPSTDKYVAIAFSEDGDDSFVTLIDTATTVGVAGLETGKLKLTDHAASVPVYLWVNETGVLSISRSLVETENKVTITPPTSAQEDRVVIDTPVPTSDDVGKSILLGSDLRADWGVPAAPYFVATPLGGTGTVGAYVLSTAVVYPRMDVPGASEISRVSVSGQDNVGIQFSKPGVYAINGMFQIANNEGTLSAEMEVEPATGSSLSAGDVISSGGGILHSGVGNCVFGATVRVSSADAAATATVWLKVTLSQAEGAQTYKLVGSFGYININRVSDYA